MKHALRRILEKKSFVLIKKGLLVVIACLGSPHSLTQCLKIQREQKIRRQVNPSHFTKFGKIRRNSEKFDRNAFDERKEQEFFGNTKIG
jgi:hypothetical protein